MLKNKEEKTFQVIGNIFMMIISLTAIIPIILIITSSLTDNNTLIQHGYTFFPKKWSFYAYTYVFQSGNNVIRAYFNGFFVTAVGTSVSLTITTMLAYTLSRKGLPGRSILTFLVFFTMLFNGGLVPTYINYATVFNIKNTYFALLIPNLLMNAFNVLLTKSYFVTGVPDEILEAASIDGAGEFKTFHAIALPMAKPIVATIALFTGISYWNDWQNGYVYLTDATNLYTIQNLLNRMIQNIQYLMSSSTITNANSGLSSIPSVSVRMSMAVLGIIPIIIIYPFIQSNFVKGITLGGVKG